MNKDEEGGLLEEIERLDREMARVDMLNDELDYNNIMLKKMIYHLRRAVKLLIVSHSGQTDVHQAIENGEMVIDMTEGMYEA